MFDKIPMRTGWNVISSTRLPEKQIVCYMKPIQLPPTKLMLWKKPWSVQLILQKQYNQDKYLSHTILQLLRLQKEYNLENPQSMITFSLCLDLFILNFLFFFIAWKIYWRFRWTLYSFWMWYCSNGIHEQVFERQDVQSM